MNKHHHKKLQALERDQIALWRGQGVTQREIARRLGRSVSTINDELRRNGHAQAGYVAIHAHQRATERKSGAGKRYPLKDPVTYAFVTEQLRHGWSPEQIAGRLTKKHPDQHIHPETIYRFIYAPENQARQRWEYLPRQHRKRRRHRGRKHHRGHIPQRVSIHDRPTVINDRLAFGHWEGDTVEGKGHRDGLHTEVERRSRFLMAEKVARIASPETAQVQQAMFTAVPPKARHSTTLDNGRENHEHTALHRLGMKTYFADPYSSWQRGTNEYHNGLLRRYFPKGTDLASVPDEELQAVVAEINARPRKCLDWETPAEVFQRESGVRIQGRM